VAALSASTQPEFSPLHPDPDPKARCRLGRTTAAAMPEVMPTNTWDNGQSPFWAIGLFECGLLRRHAHLAGLPLGLREVFWLGSFVDIMREAALVFVAYCSWLMSAVPPVVNP